MRQLTGRQRRAAIALAVVAALFCAIDVAGAPFESARGGVQGFMGALYRGTDSVLGPARQWVQGVAHVPGNAATISAQRQQIGELTRERDALAQDAQTAATVAGLQLQANRGGYHVVPGRVTAIGPGGGFDWTVVLDAGGADGVRVGQSVIAGADLVGRVVRVWPSSATVLMAADPHSGVGVRDRRTGDIGVVTGTGTGTYTYTALDPSARPRVGDVLVTGPRGSTTYVTGLRVGTVTSVASAPDGSVRASVAAAAAPGTLDVVGVVLVGGHSAPRSGLTPSREGTTPSREGTTPSRGGTTSAEGPP